MFIPHKTKRNGKTSYNTNILDGVQQDEYFKEVNCSLV